MPPRLPAFLRKLQPSFLTPREPDPTGARSVSVSRRIAAPAPRIFAVLVDPTKHPELDGSGTVRNVRAGAASRLGPGVRFSADMRRTVPYRVRNKVVEFEEGRKIAWAHAGGHRWRYQLKPEADGTTLVIETFDWSTSPVPWVIERLGFPVHNLPGMEESLARLEALSTATR